MVVVVVIRAEGFADGTGFTVRVYTVWDLLRLVWTGGAARVVSRMLAVGGCHFRKPHDRWKLDVDERGGLFPAAFNMCIAHPL